MHLSPTAVTTEDSTVVYKTKNLYADEDRDIYFFSDVPHLPFEIVGLIPFNAHSNSRALWVSLLQGVCYSYSTEPGIYGSKPTESEGVARGQGRFTLP